MRKPFNLYSPPLITLMVRFLVTHPELQELTLKIVRLAIHEDVVDKYNAEDAGPQVQVAE